MSYIEYKLEDGGTFLVEVNGLGMESGVVRSANPEELAVKSSQTFEVAIEKIKPVANAIISKVNDLNKEIDEIEVKFGIKLSAEAGVIFASTGIESNFDISLKWKPK